MAQMVKNLPPTFDPYVRKIPCRREWQPTPLFLSGESRGQRSLVGYSPWGHKESDRTERVTLSLSHMAINSVQVSPSASALPSSMEVSVGLQGNCQASWLTMVLVLDLPSLPPPLTNIDLGYVLDPCLWLVTSGFPHVHPNICMLTSSVP